MINNDLIVSYPGFSVRVSGRESWSFRFFQHHVKVDGPKDKKDGGFIFCRRPNSVPGQSLTGIRRLIRHQSGELKSYLEYETKQVLKIGIKKRFC